MSLLRPTSQAATKTLSVRVPTALHADIEAVKQEAATRGLSLDLTAVIVKAVAGAVKTARAELSTNRMQKAQPK